MRILLTTFNARYAHTALGIRYLKANMKELSDDTAIREFVTGANVSQAAEALLAEKPSIIGVSVYIWNVKESAELVSLIKRVSPETLVIAGGPEVSHETESSPLAKLADVVIRGRGEKTFYDVCRAHLDGSPVPRGIIDAEELPLSQIKSPYFLYTDEDIAHRTVYVESSRGCPFRCAFCLSSLDRRVDTVDADAFLADMRTLYDRGVRSFRFVDRTFNLAVARSVKILSFFLEKALSSENFFVHLEMVPDFLPDELKDLLRRFPRGSCQLEIGIQTFDETVQSLIDRRQDPARTAENLIWLKENTSCYLHTDLIAGLPGQTLDMFAKDFDTLYSFAPDEIQPGILKRLKGTPILRHCEPYRLVFEEYPPYSVLSTKDISFADMQRLKRFSRYFELVANSGRFTTTVSLIAQNTPFARFMALTDFIYDKTGAMFGVSLERLARLIGEFLVETGTPEAVARTALTEDFVSRKRVREIKAALNAPLGANIRQASRA